MSAPTLHEIAAMPYSETVAAIRQHYDPAWGKNDEDGEPVTAWRVRADWTLTGSFNETIEAKTEKEAEEIAREMVADDYYSGDLDVDFIKIEPARGEAS